MQIHLRDCSLWGFYFLSDPPPWLRTPLGVLPRERFSSDPQCPYLLPFTDAGALDPSPAHSLQKTVTMDVHFMFTMLSEHWDVVTIAQQHALQDVVTMIHKREILNAATMLPEAETMTVLARLLFEASFASTRSMYLVIKGRLFSLRNTFNNIGKGPRRWLLGGIVSVPYLLTPTMSEAEKAVKEREAKEAPQLNTTSHARKEAFLDTSTTARSFKSFPPQLNRTQPPKLPA
ncbi:hypothetical protein B0H13DRAFT_1868173 [Mycena leptocephala]|nr:hypothetical protein B0H13DRAFT_1868173 [Mycena leptocephala]